MDRLSLVIVRQAIAGLSVMVLFLTACTNGGTSIPQASRPPQIPPESSFVIDFSAFKAPAGASSSGETSLRLASFAPSGAVSYLGRADAIGDRSNWGYAALNVGFWNIVGVFGLAVPVASFVESFKHNPVQQADNSWVWAYSVPVLGSVYEAELNGKYIDRGVRWEMHVSKQGEYADFLWYYGESDLPATSGFWMLKNKPSEPTDLLRIDWQRNPAQQTGNIKYTNVVPGGAENGGHISYSVSTSKPYDRAYTIYNKGKSQTTYIEWNDATRDGRVKDSAHFKDNNWHYWDSELINAEVR